MLKTAGFTFVSKLISAGLNFGLIIWISNVLGPEERGKCAFFLIIIVVMVGISEMAGGATTAYLMQRFSPEAIVQLHGKWSLLPVILVPIIFYVFKTISLTEMILIGAGGWFHCRWNMQQHILLALQHFKRFNFSNVLAPFITILFFGVFLLNDFTSRLSYLLSLVLSWAILFISNLNFLKAEWSKPASSVKEVAVLKDLMKPGMINQLGHIVSLLNNRLVFFILPAMQLGLWSNALTISESLLMVPGSLGQIMYAELASGANQVNSKKVFRNAFFYNSVFMATGLFFLAILPDAFWTYVFGKGFAGLKQYIFIILPGLGFYSFYLVITYRQSAAGKFLYNLFPLVIGLLLNLGGTIFLTLSGNYSLLAGIWLLSISWVLISLAAGISFYRHDRAGKFSFH
jgi:O-antigen/teichoic acid export membrane protein